jgi:small subunit ribosomal protein S4
MLDSKCKICRRVGVKLFLKGERCMSPKCALVKRPYVPGNKGKRRKKALSEFGKELKEKQKLRNLYHLSEKQFKNYVKEILEKRGGVEDAGVLLMKKLTSRLDNVIFEAGFANSRAQARQFVSHRHFMVNGRRVSIPSFEIKKGDIIKLSPSSVKKPAFSNIAAYLKKHKTPPWMELDIEKMEIKIISDPVVEKIDFPVEISSIFEYYSR